MNNLAVVIYAHNQDHLIGEVVRDLAQEDIAVFVVDDYSTDFTGLYARSNGAWVINTKSKIGKCRGLLKAFNLAINLEQFDYIATIELNDQIKFNSLFDLLELMPTNDLVIGSSQLSFTKSIFNTLFNLATEAKFKDWFSGYRIYRTNLIQELIKYPEGFTDNIQIEMLAKSNVLGATIIDFPIDYTSKESFNLWETFKSWWEALKYPKRKDFTISEDLW